MTVDYIVSSLPTLAFGQPAPISWDGFMAACGDKAESIGRIIADGAWKDLETQLRNAAAEARNGEQFMRRASGCSIYWRDRVRACFQETDILKRDEMLDKAWWDAAGELSAPSSPLGIGALATYAVRLKIALRRDMISTDRGNAAFDRMTAEEKK